MDVGNGSLGRTVLNIMVHQRARYPPMAMTRPQAPLKVAQLTSELCLQFCSVALLFRKEYLEDEIARFFLVYYELD